MALFGLSHDIYPPKSISHSVHGIFSEPYQRYGTSRIFIYFFQNTYFLHFQSFKIFIPITLFLGNTHTHIHRQYMRMQIQVKLGQKLLGFVGKLTTTLVLSNGAKKINEHKWVQVKFVRSKFKGSQPTSQPAKPRRGGTSESTKKSTKTKKKLRVMKNICNSRVVSLTNSC